MQILHTPTTQTAGRTYFGLHFSGKRGCLIHSVSKAQTQKHYLFKDFDFSKLKAVRQSWVFIL